VRDFNLQITVRNARLLAAIRERFGSAAEMCRAAGISQSSLSALLTMRAAPFRADGSLTSPAEQVVSALGIPADDLWPSHIARLRAKKARVEIEMDAPAFAAITADADPEQTAIYRQAIGRWSRNLTERERTALAVHHSGGTFDDVGAAIGGVTRERARQIVVKAERKMRKCARIDGVRDWRGIAS
jgi:lambda repressor-like predicted transcriptional regulator